MKIVVFTGSELRHAYMRMALALSPGIEVAASYCEGTEKSLVRMIAERTAPGDERARHLQAREQCEQDFFASLVRYAPDRSQPTFVPAGDINLPEVCEHVRSLEPDLLVAYGCTIVREPLLSAFAGRFLNLHLGLSPYYRGGGTNFWPLVNGEPEFVGATFMHIDAGIDTGQIIHQIRARFFPGDTPHTVGNRLIADAARVYSEIIRNFRQLEPMPQPPQPTNARYYKKADFTEEAVRTVYANFAAGLVDRRLQLDESKLAPIVTNPLIADALAGQECAAS